MRCDMRGPGDTAEGLRIAGNCGPKYDRTSVVATDEAPPDMRELRALVSILDPNRVRGPKNTFA